MTNPAYEQIQTRKVKVRLRTLPTQGKAEFEVTICDFKFRAYQRRAGSAVTESKTFATISGRSLVSLAMA